MSKIKFFAALLLLVTVGYGCSDVAFDGNATEEQTTATAIRTPGEAAEIAFRALGRDSRAGAQYTLQCYTSSLPGRSGNDTTAYIVNFSNPEGFAIVIADKNLTPLLAYSNENCFDLDCESGQVIQSVYLDALSYGGPYRPDTSDIKPFDPAVPPRDDSIPSIAEYKMNEIKPIERLKHWSQKAPYNKYCPVKTENVEGVWVTDNTLVGCVALAAGQVLLECSESLDFYGLSIPSTNDLVYTVFNDTTSADYAIHLETLSQFLYLLGSKELKMRYGLIGSSTYSEYVPPVLRKYGCITLTSGLVPYDAQTIVDDLNDYCLVLMSTDAFIIETGKQVSGHIWVVDGCYQVPLADLNREIQTWLHFEWGDGGRNNGYYSGSTYHIGTWVPYEFGRYRNEYMSVRIGKERI